MEWSYSNPRDAKLDNVMILSSLFESFSSAYYNILMGSTALLRPFSSACERSSNLLAGVAVDLCSRI